MQVLSGYKINVCRYIRYIRECVQVRCWPGGSQPHLLPRKPRHSSSLDFCLRKPKQCILHHKSIVSENQSKSLNCFCGSNCNCNCNQPHRKPKQSALHRQNNLNIVAKCPFLVFRFICTFPHLFANLPARIVPQDSHPPSSHTRAATTMLPSLQSRCLVTIQVHQRHVSQNKYGKGFCCWSSYKFDTVWMWSKYLPWSLFPWLAFLKPPQSSYRLWCIHHTCRWTWDTIIMIIMIIQVDLGDSEATCTNSRNRWQQNIVEGAK